MSSQSFRLVVSAIRLRIASEHNGNGDEKPARVLRNSRFLLKELFLDLFYAESKKSLRNFVISSWF